VVDKRGRNARVRVGKYGRALNGGRGRGERVGEGADAID
jgi:hypothetical protein